MNGRSWPGLQAPDHTAILVRLSEQMGEVRSDVRHLREDVAELRQSRSPRPLSDWMTLGLGIALVAAAAAGKVTWAEALPSLTGLVGR